MAWVPFIDNTVGATIQLDGISGSIGWEGDPGHLVASGTPGGSRRFFRITGPRDTQVRITIHAYAAYQMEGAGPGVIYTAAYFYGSPIPFMVDGQASWYNTTDPYAAGMWGPDETVEGFVPQEPMPLPLIIYPHPLPGEESEPFVIEYYGVASTGDRIQCEESWVFQIEVWDAGGPGPGACFWTDLRNVEQICE